MSSGPRPVDWFDFADATTRIKASEQFVLGPDSIDVSEGMAPDATPQQIKAVQKKRFQDKFYPRKCKQGDWRYYSGDMRSVASRLPIWC